MTTVNDRIAMSIRNTVAGATLISNNVAGATPISNNVAVTTIHRSSPPSAADSDGGGLFVLPEQVP